MARRSTYALAREIRAAGRRRRGLFATVARMIRRKKGRRNVSVLRNPDDMNKVLIMVGLAAAGVVVLASTVGKSKFVIPDAFSGLTPHNVRLRAEQEANVLRGYVKSIWKDSTGWIAEIVSEVGGFSSTLIVRLFGVNGLRVVCRAAADNMSLWQVDKSVSINRDDTYNWDLFRQHSRMNLGCDPGDYPVTEFLTF